MYCRWCGAQNPDDASFCNKCGRYMAIEQQERSTVQPSTGNTYQSYSTVSTQTQVDNTIQPLTIFCIILCLLGAATFFMTIAEAFGYNSSTMEYYTITYDGISMMFDRDLAPGGMYGSIFIAARVCPIFISLLYVFLAYLFYTCFNRRPGVEFPICLFIQFILVLILNASIVAVPTFQNSYLKETLYSGWGVTIAFWACIILMILGYILSKKMEKAGFRQ